MDRSVEHLRLSKAKIHNVIVQFPSVKHLDMSGEPGLAYEAHRPTIHATLACPAPSNQCSGSQVLASGSRGGAERQLPGAGCQNVRNRNIVILARMGVKIQSLTLGHAGSAVYGKPRITNQVCILCHLQPEC